MSHSVAGVEGRWAGILFTWSGESGMVSLTTDCQDMAALNLVMGIRDTSALQFLYTCKPLELAHRMLILFQQHIVSFYLWCAFQNRWFIAILNAHLWWFHYVFVLITGYWQSVKIKTLFCFFLLIMTSPTQQYWLNQLCEFGVKLSVCLANGRQELVKKNCDFPFPETAFNSIYNNVFKNIYRVHNTAITVWHVMSAAHLHHLYSSSV